MWLLLTMRILTTLNKLVSIIITFGNDQISLFQQSTSFVTSRKCFMGGLWYIEFGRNASWKSSWRTCHQNPTNYSIPNEIRKFDHDQLEMFDIWLYVKRLFQLNCFVFSFCYECVFEWRASTKLVGPIQWFHTF